MWWLQSDPGSWAVSVVVPLIWVTVNAWAPFVSCVTAWTFAKHAASLIAAGQMFAAVPHTFATTVVTALSLMLVGQLLLDGRDSLDRTAIRQEGQHDTLATRSLRGKFCMVMAQAVGIPGSALKVVGAFVYIHSDLGVIDFLGWFYIRSASVGTRFRTLAVLLFRRTWSVLALLMLKGTAWLSAIVISVWAVVKMLADSLRKILQLVWSVLSGGMYVVIKSPWLSLTLSLSVMYSAFHCHSNNINVVQEATGALAVAMRFLGTKTELVAGHTDVATATLAAFLSYGVDHLMIVEWRGKAVKVLQQAAGNGDVLARSAVSSCRSLFSVQEDS